MEQPHDYSTAHILREMNEPVLSLGAILYLIKNDCHDASLVLKYAELADQPLRCLMEIIEREPLTYRRENPLSTPIDFGS